jgi:dihydroflavonol-4-reductase
MILITGATGFLGQYLVTAFLEAGYKLRLLVRNIENCSFKNDTNIELIEGNILDIMALEKAMEGVEYVVHAAAMVSFIAKDSEEMLKINVKGTENVVNLCLEMGVKKLVFMSSIAALGRTDNHNLISESTHWQDSPLNSQYAISKRKAELEVYRGMEEGLNVAILNPGVILGAGKWDNSSAKLFRVVYKGLPFYNRGINGFVGAADVAKAARIILENNTEEGERFVLVAQNMSQKEMFGLMAESLGKTPPRYEFPPILARLAGFLLETFAKITGTKALITRETVRTSLHQYFYDGTHISKRFDFQYTPMKEVIAEAGKIFLAEHTK